MESSEVPERALRELPVMPVRLNKKGKKGKKKKDDLKAGAGIEPTARLELATFRLRV